MLQPDSSGVLQPSEGFEIPAPAPPSWDESACAQYLHSEHEPVSWSVGPTRACEAMKALLKGLITSLLFSTTHKPIYYHSATYAWRTHPLCPIFSPSSHLHTCTHLTTVKCSSHQCRCREPEIWLFLSKPHFWEQGTSVFGAPENLL